MTRPYSNDLRERVVGAVERGELSCRQAAAHYGVGISTAIKWVQRLRRTGSVSPSKIGGYRPKKLIGSWRLWLLDRCRGGDFTLRGLVAELAEPGPEGGLPSGVGDSTGGNGGVTRIEPAVLTKHRARGAAQSQKKTLTASEQDRPDVARRRAQWLRYRHRIDP